MMSKKIFLLLLLPIFSCSSSRYDTSTPEKFVESMGLIGQQPKSENPLPFFYEKESAISITKFDEVGGKCQDSWNKMRGLIAEKFPNNIKSNQEGRLKIVLDVYAKMKTRTFSFSATQIGPQLKERKPSDYEFVSCTEPNENGVCQITVKMMGNAKTIPIKKSADGYRLFLEPDVLKNMDETVEKIKGLEKVFADANQLLETGKITEENFEVKMQEVYTNYQNALD